MLPRTVAGRHWFTQTPRSVVESEGCGCKKVPTEASSRLPVCPPLAHPSNDLTPAYPLVEALWVLA